jgi:hypothetical protein
MTEGAKNLQSPSDDFDLQADERAKAAGEHYKAAKEAKEEAEEGLAEIIGEKSVFNLEKIRKYINTRFQKLEGECDAFILMLESPESLVKNKTILDARLKELTTKLKIFQEDFKKLAKEIKEYNKEIKDATKPKVESLQTLLEKINSLIDEKTADKDKASDSNHEATLESVTTQITGYNEELDKIQKIIDSKKVIKAKDYEKGKKELSEIRNGLGYLDNDLKGNNTIFEKSTEINDLRNRLIDINVILDTKKSQEVIQQAPNVELVEKPNELTNKKNEKETKEKRLEDTRDRYLSLKYKIAGTGVGVLKNLKFLIGKRGNPFEWDQDELMSAEEQYKKAQAELIGENVSAYLDQMLEKLKIEVEMNKQNKPWLIKKFDKLAKNQTFAKWRKRKGRLGLGLWIMGGAATGLATVGIGNLAAAGVLGLTKAGGWIYFSKILASIGLPIAGYNFGGKTVEGKYTEQSLMTLTDNDQAEVNDLSQERRALTGGFFSFGRKFKNWTNFERGEKVYKLTNKINQKYYDHIHSGEVSVEELNSIMIQRGVYLSQEGIDPDEDVFLQELMSSITEKIDLIRLSHGETVTHEGESYQESFKQTQERKISEIQTSLMQMLKENLGKPKDEDEVIKVLDNKNLGIPKKIQNSLLPLFLKQYREKGDLTLADIIQNKKRLLSSDKKKARNEEYDDINWVFDDKFIRNLRLQLIKNEDFIEFIGKQLDEGFRMVNQSFRQTISKKTIEKETNQKVTQVILANLDKNIIAEIEETLEYVKKSSDRKSLGTGIGAILGGALTGISQYLRPGIGHASPSHSDQVDMTKASASITDQGGLNSDPEGQDAIDNAAHAIEIAAEPHILETPDIEKSEGFYAYCNRISDDPSNIPKDMTKDQFIQAVREWRGAKQMQALFGKDIKFHFDEHNNVTKVEGTHDFSNWKPTTREEIRIATERGIYKPPVHRESVFSDRFRTASFGGPPADNHGGGGVDTVDAINNLHEDVQPGGVIGYDNSPTDTLKSLADLDQETSVVDSEAPTLRHVGNKTFIGFGNDDQLSVQRTESGTFQIFGIEKLNIGTFESITGDDNLFDDDIVRDDYLQQLQILTLPGDKKARLENSFMNICRQIYAARELHEYEDSLPGYVRDVRVQMRQDIISEVRQFEATYETAVFDEEYGGQSTQIEPLITDLSFDEPSDSSERMLKPLEPLPRTNIPEIEVENELVEAQPPLDDESSSPSLDDYRQSLDINLLDNTLIPSHTLENIKAFVPENAEKVSVDFSYHEQNKAGFYRGVVSYEQRGKFYTFLTEPYPAQAHGVIPDNMFGRGDFESVPDLRPGVSLYGHDASRVFNKTTEQISDNLFRILRQKNYLDPDNTYALEVIISDDNEYKTLNVINAQTQQSVHHVTGQRVDEDLISKLLSAKQNPLEEQIQAPASDEIEPAQHDQPQPERQAEEVVKSEPREEPPVEEVSVETREVPARAEVRFSNGQKVDLIRNSRGNLVIKTNAAFRIKPFYSITEDLKANHFLSPNYNQEIEKLSEGKRMLAITDASKLYKYNIVAQQAAANGQPEIARILQSQISHDIQNIESSLNANLFGSMYDSGKTPQITDNADDLLAVAEMADPLPIEFEGGKLRIYNQDSGEHTFRITGESRLLRSRELIDKEILNSDYKDEMIKNRPNIDDHTMGHNYEYIKMQANSILRREQAANIAESSGYSDVAEKLRESIKQTVQRLEKRFGNIYHDRL